MRRGTEPPPHVHSREDEFFCVFDGKLEFYTEGQIILVSGGECMFLPKGKPRAFLIQSAETEVLVFMTPVGFLNAVNKMNAPAQEMELPADDALTYSTADLTETMKIFEKYVSIFFLRRRSHNRCPGFRVPRSPPWPPFLIDRRA
jgi:uncharacterized cupin superfamily protein